METPARFERLTLLVLALVHLVVQLTHGYSHIEADVSLSAMQQVFIYVVATFMPLAAVFVTLRKDVRLGAGLFAVSMAAAFLFGYLAHFVIDSPDLHSNVVGEHADFFFHSALSLAIIEFAGFAFGFAIATRKPRWGIAAASLLVAAVFEVFVEVYGGVGELGDVSAG